MSADMAEKKKRILPPVTLDESYQLCRDRVNRRLGDDRWMAGNLDAATKAHLSAVLALATRTEKLCDIHLARNARRDLLDDLREDFRNNFMEEETTDQFPALLDTMRRHQIPQQYLHDIVAAADMCLRIDRFTSFDQWLQLGCRLGGATMVASVFVVGSEKAGFEEDALKMGQAIYLTQLLNDVADEIQKLEYFMPVEDIESLGVDLSRHNPAQPNKAIIRLVRLQVERIERLFYEGGSLLNYLSLDGRRMLKTIVSVSWNMLMKIKRDPEKVLLASGELSPAERFRFRLKHLMGLEGGVVVLPEDADHDHH